MRDEWYKEASLEIAEARTLAALQDIKNAWLGKKGQISEALKQLGKKAPEVRRAQGQILNVLRQQVTQELDAKWAVLEEAQELAQLEQERIDMTIPGRIPLAGALHPMTRVRRLVEDVLLRMGFSLQYGPEVETEWYNFEALNIPANHPARDMQDSFFVDVPGMVLRTHTSPVQIRGMERAGGQLPVKIQAPGFVYRRDDDATHTPMFSQIEGLFIDRGITLGDLKGTLTTMARELLGNDIKTRFRPSYFPFTEPSVELDVTCAVCAGRGCRTCKWTGWVEILGSGMVHPVVIANGGYNPDDVTGFAFGLGIERVTMRIYGLDDLRLLYQNPVDFIKHMRPQQGGLL